MERGKLMTELKDDEGYVPHAYQDSEGFWTIGYGFLIDERKNAEIPKHIAELWLTHLVDKRCEQLLDRLPWIANHPEPVQRALANMAYQLGVSGVVGFKNTLKLISQGRYVEAAEEALNSKWAIQTPNRAKRVSEMIKSGSHTP